MGDRAGDAVKGHSIFRTTAMVSGCIAASRLLGFVREVLMAVFFGTSLAKSAFDVAFRIPNLFRQLFGEGALSAAFVPVFSETLEKEGREVANRLAARCFVLLGLVLLGVMLLLYAALGLAEPWIVGDARGAMVLPLLRIMLPYLWFICMVALAMGVLNTYRHFLVPAATPVLLNLVWIATLVLVCPLWGDAETQIRVVGWGIVAAGALQLLAQVPLLRARGIRLSIGGSLYSARVARILSLMGPVALGMGVHQVNVVIDGFLALWAGGWAPAALTYAERLIYLPLGIFATALQTVLLPEFSRMAARGEHERMTGTLRTSLEQVCLTVLPAATALAVLAAPVVRLVYMWQGGAFDEQSVELTARALAFYAPGLVVFSVYKLLVPAFYAFKDTVTPVRVGVQMVALNFGLNVLAVIGLPEFWRHAGLAGSTVLASGLNCLLLGWRLRRHAPALRWRPFLATAVRILLACLLMAVVLRQAQPQLLAAWSGAALPRKVVELAALVAAGLLGMGVYVAAGSVLFRRLLLHGMDAFRRVKSEPTMEVPHDTEP